MIYTKKGDKFGDLFHFLQVQSSIVFNDLTGWIKTPENQDFYSGIEAKSNFFIWIMVSPWWWCFLWWRKIDTFFSLRTPWSLFDPVYEVSWLGLNLINFLDFLWPNRESWIFMLFGKKFMWQRANCVWAIYLGPV